MSETIIGVIVGGVISILTQLVILSANSKQWQKEKRLESLNVKREELREVFGLVSEQVGGLDRLRTISQLENRPLDADEVDEVYQYKGNTRFILPQDVYEAYQNFIVAWAAKTKEQEFRASLGFLNGLMTKHIRELDSQIEALLDEKRKPLLERIFG